MTGDGHMFLAFVKEAALLEPGLARWTAAAVWAGLSPARRRRIRDALLREAARGLAPLSAWQKAHLLAELTRQPRSRPDVTTPGGLVALARAIYRPSDRDGPLSVGQLFRVISHIPGGEMRAAPALALRPEATVNAFWEDM